MPSPESVTITVNKDECTGCGVCATEAPDTFELNDDDIAEVKNPPGDDMETIMAAAEGCPSEAIVIVDKDSGEQIYPEA